ncbi:M50 family metallopeptidase [Legionella shakespearei]|uniref:Membrane associated zinc metalloprotease n=1 Tax=Legionella shakespearei DSM 23087 TaxID=1122169 RepID=A0A0W0YKQ4_9GAMM|nr:site-2 protease family protein [Legionella shakespearei]KTD57279.1 membrane associated zinc metalloprotease [Legionella shakespearei DSM 23087]
MLMAILAIILTLILVVGIHEAGHGIAARIFGVKIKKISIGFGKPLIQWQRPNGTVWSWAMWPLGGYVDLLNTRITPVKPAEEPYCFDKKPVWVRLIILLAGVFANLLTAWIAFALVFYIGIAYKVPQVQSVQPDSLAAQAGINPGDQVLAIQGRQTSSWNAVGMQLIIFWGQKDIKVTVKQAQNQALKEVTLDLSLPRFTQKQRSLLAGLGISPDASAAQEVVRASSLTDAMWQAKTTILHLLYFFIMILKQLFTGALPFFILLGPLGIFAASVASLTQGVMIFIYFIATFSVAVALVNLFPLPGLDGGSMVYLLIEKIRGKPISVAMEVLLYKLMMIVFCVLLVQLCLNDLARLV